MKRRISALLLVLAAGCGEPDAWTQSRASLRVEARWSRPSLLDQPDGRYHAAMAYDHVNEYVVLFGGTGSGGVLGDTWIWDGQTWAPAVSTGPAARLGASMLWDDSRQRLVLFGGRPPTGVEEDVWEWMGDRWEQVSGVAPGPGPRVYHAAATAGPGAPSYVFGGRDSVNQDHDDTWAWNGAWSWVAEGPMGARIGAALVTRGPGDLLLFGGQESARVGDSWTVQEGGSWEARTSATAPSARLNAAAAHHPASGCSVVIGGDFYDAARPAGAAASDTWCWDGAGWRLLDETGAGARIGASLVHDPVRDELVLFGGYAITTQPLADTRILRLPVIEESDGGVPVDGGPGEDGGTTEDAGTDGGPGDDGGTAPVDDGGGVADGGGSAPTDGGALADGGTQLPDGGDAPADGGPTDGLANPYGCTTSGTGALGPAVLLALLALLLAPRAGRRRILRRRRAGPGPSHLALVAGLLLSGSPGGAAAAGLAVPDSSTELPAATDPATTDARVRPRLGFLGIEAGRGVEADAAQALSNFLEAELGELDVYELLSMKDIRTLLGFEAQKQILGCAEDASCLAEIGGSVGADRLLSGSVARIGGSVLLTLTLLDVRASRAVARAGERIRAPDDLEPVLEAIPPMLVALVAQDPGAQPPPMPRGSSPGGVRPPPAPSTAGVTAPRVTRPYPDHHPTPPSPALEVAVGWRADALLGAAGLATGAFADLRWDRAGVAGAVLVRPLGLRLEARYWPVTLGAASPYFGIGVAGVIYDGGEAGGAALYSRTALGVAFAVDRVRVFVEGAYERALVGEVEPHVGFLGGGVAWSL